MRILIETEVKGEFRDVMSRFDRALFEALVPPLAKLEILEFTGTRKGDRVHLRFLSPVKADWISVITEDGQDDQQAWFVDVGERLPPGLSSWEHRHIVRKSGPARSLIIDDIRYTGSNLLMEWLAKPVLYASFLARKKVYRKYFGEPESEG